jgi:UDP-N-acetylglucosamine:LPS N-acetylglucosamine transferase
VLILTASVGEGHDLPARTLAAQLRGERPETEIVMEDGLAAMGRLFVAVNEGAPRIIFYRLQWIYDAAFWLFVRFAPTRRLTQELVGRVGSRGVTRLIEAAKADVVVSTYPMTTEVLGWLRRRGRLETPVCAAITDLAAMHYWAARGVDVHLVTHPESIEEVLQVAGLETEAYCVHGLTAPEFAEPRESAAARRALGLPRDGKVVLVSGGGWGVGDLESAVETALSLDVAEVVCLCGRNGALRDRIQARFRGDERVRVVGFTDRMGDWLAACDALVHSTAGLTVLEAHIRGCPTISYGWGRGHIRLNNEAFRRFGLADVVTSRAALASALRRALTARKPQNLSFASLPSAASLVLARAGEQTADGG